MTSIVIDCATGVTFDDSTDLIVGTSPTIAHADVTAVAASPGTTTVTVTSAIGQTFDTTENLIVGGTIIDADDVTAISSSTTADRSGMLATGVTSTPLPSTTTTVEVTTVLGVSLDASTMDLVVGGTHIVTSDLINVTSSIVPDAVGTLRVALVGAGTTSIIVDFDTGPGCDTGVAFRTTADLIVGSMTVAQSDVTAATQITETVGAGRIRVTVPLCLQRGDHIRVDGNRYDVDWTLPVNRTMETVFRTMSFAACWIITAIRAMCRCAPRSRSCLAALPLVECFPSSKYSNGTTRMSSSSCRYDCLSSQATSCRTQVVKLVSGIERRQQCTQHARDVGTRSLT